MVKKTSRAKLAPAADTGTERTETASVGDSAAADASGDYRDAMVVMGFIGVCLACIIGSMVHSDNSRAVVRAKFAEERAHGHARYNDCMAARALGRAAVCANDSAAAAAAPDAGIVARLCAYDDSIYNDETYVCEGIVRADAAWLEHASWCAAVLYHAEALVCTIGRDDKDVCLYGVSAGSWRVSWHAERSFRGALPEPAEPWCEHYLATQTPASLARDGFTAPFATWHVSYKHIARECATMHDLERIGADVRAYMDPYGAKTITRRDAWALIGCEGDAPAPGEPDWLYGALSFALSESVQVRRVVCAEPGRCVPRYVFHMV